MLVNREAPKAFYFLVVCFFLLAASCATKPPIYKNRTCTRDGRCTEEQVRVVGGQITKFKGTSWSRCQDTKCDEFMEYSQIGSETSDPALNRKFISRQTYSIPASCVKDNHLQSGAPIDCKGFKYRDHSSVLPGVEWTPLPE